MREESGVSISQLHFAGVDTLPYRWLDLFSKDATARGAGRAGPFLCVGVHTSCQQGGGSWQNLTTDRRGQRGIKWHGDVWAPGVLSVGLLRGLTGILLATQQG